MMVFEGYHFWGMHLIWWFVWMVMLIWIFATPYNIPGQKLKKDTPLDIIKRRFASGEISREQYLEYKIILEKQ